MKKQQQIPFLWFFLFFVSVGLFPAGSAVATELLPPQQALYDASEKMKARVQDPNFVRDFKKFTEFVDTVIYPQVDFNRLSALVLGRHWKEASRDQQERFKKEFKMLLVRTYSRAFLEFREWSVRFLPLHMNDGDKKLIVKTEVLQPGQQPIGVDYRMALTREGWKVYDITIEGVSLVTNYRNSFKTEIERTGSLDGVIDTLAARNAEALRSPNS
ncbi:MAG: MlaC/ttg2D family ABC transporter substrate-binding protein [Gammaproteobacteria bacterium]